MGLVWAACADARAQAPKLAGANRATDVRPCAWQSSPGAGVTHQGNWLVIRAHSLPLSAPRQVTCWVHVPGRGPSVVEGFNHGAVTEQGWTFALAAPSGSKDRVRLLYQGSQEGQFRFPVPAPGGTNDRIGIEIGIPGDNPGRLSLSELKLEPAPRAVPAAPHAVSPGAADAPTPAGADFYWLAPPGAEPGAYELEWRRRGGKIHSLRLASYFTTDAIRASPRQRLSPGRYVWRVRAFSLLDTAGPWSPWMAFTVHLAPRTALPDFAPSAANPFFVVEWGSLGPEHPLPDFPGNIRPHMLIRIGGTTGTVPSMLAWAKARNIPVALQVNGPHDIIAGRWDRLPLARVLDWAREFPNLKAFYICEQTVQGGIENSEVRDYLERLIAIGAETGRPVIWADANWGQNVWLSVVANRAFRAFLRAHRGYLIPVWKMNGGFVPYLAPAGLLGLWLRGTVSAWGVQPESWYWVEAGFRGLGTQLDYKQGVRTDAPPVIFQQLALVGASAGAALYSFEPGTDAVSSGLGDAHSLQDIFLPLARLLLSHTIPAESEVSKAVFAWHEIHSRNDLAFRKGYPSTLRALFARTLGIEYPFEAIPESGACYWIPFAPPASPSPRRLRSLPDRECPAPAAGQAAIFRVGETAFVFNSRVNWPVEQTFRFVLGDTPVAGSLGVNGWLVAKRVGSNRVQLTFSARPGAPIAFDFTPSAFWRKAGRGARWSRKPAENLQFRAGKAPQSMMVRPIRATVPTSGARSEDHLRLVGLRVPRQAGLFPSIP